MKALLKASLAAALVISVAGISNAQEGTITGKVNFKGTAPGEKSIDMAADAACKALHPEPPKTRHYVVNSDGTIQNVLVYVKSGPSVDGKTFEAPKSKMTLDQKGCMYLPYVMGVVVGQEIEILNSDETLHNVHAQPTVNDEFNKGQPVKGMKFSHKFTKPEFSPPVKFKCDVHPWMFAYVGVFPHAFFDVTRDGGTFKLTGLAPGKHVIEIWHHKAGTQTAEIEVKAGENKLDFTIEPKQ